MKHKRTYHGLRHVPEYVVWKRMRNRCYQKTDKSFKNYGGRGITICAAWFADFRNFYRDMGSRPHPKMMLDRIDNDGPYSPENCRWANVTQQARNRRSNRYLVVEDKKICLTELAEKNFACPKRLHDRLKANWPLRAALFAPPKMGHIPDFSLYESKEIKT